MKVAALRFTRRFNTGNYQFEELSVEAVPDEGQTAEDLLSQTKSFVNGNQPGSNGAPVSNGTPPTNYTKTGEKTPTDELPQTKGRSPANGNGKKKKGRGRPPKAVTECRRAIDSAREAEDLEEFADFFELARANASAIDIDEWEDAMKEFAGIYRSLNSPDANEDLVKTLIQAFKAEKTALEERRQNDA